MITAQHRSVPRARQEHAAWYCLQILLVGVLGVTVGLGPVGWSVGCSYGLATWLLLDRAMRHRGIRAVGPADRVTLTRGVLVGAIAALVADRVGREGPETVVVVLASVALALDFVDGQVARRTGTSSTLGARFDMEVDAFLILVLSAHVATALGRWVLVIGAARYVFLVGSWVLPWLRAPLRPSTARKTVAAAQGVTLVVATAEVVPHPEAVVGAAMAALLWSFGRDVVWLWRHRRPAVPRRVEGSCRV
jgi:phosphatidylglycerophosphate synthase